MKNDLWDAVIVGAGPAGGVAAALLAGRGWRVLLVERSRWPREKVCGGCVNAAAVGMLRSLGLGNVLRSRAAEALDRFALSVEGRRLSLPLPEGVAIPRSDLDARIVEEAIRRGCEFVPGAAASVLPGADGADFRSVRVHVDGVEQTIRTRLVLACDGIAGTSLDLEPWAKWNVARDAWFGVSTTLGEARSLSAERTIAMHVGRGGYVGTAPYADGRMHVAAALDSRRCREGGGPGLLVQAILQQCRVEVPAELTTAKFQGTGLLTRRRAAVGGHRILAGGDGCGYVEPFTGEGIAWAIRSAMEVVALLPASVDTWPKELAAAWGRRHRATVGKQQRWCRALRRTLRYPWAAKCGVAAAGVYPALAESLARRVGRHSDSVTPILQGAVE